MIRPGLRRSTAAAVVVALALGLATCLALAGGVGPAGAQDGGQVPTRDIIPEPGSGEAPEEAGDRGGSLQLAILGLVVVAIVGGGLYVAHQARRARAAQDPARIASQAATPSMKPER